MPKGKPWTRAQEDKLRNLIKVKLPLNVIAETLGKSLDAVRNKCSRLGLEVVVGQNFSAPTTSLELPKELLTVEGSLLVLRGAMKTLEQPGLDKTEILRLRSLIMASKIYLEKFAEYVNYRGLESELLELREKFGKLRKSAKNDAERSH